MGNCPPNSRRYMMPWNKHDKCSPYYVAGTSVIGIAVCVALIIFLALLFKRKANGYQKAPSGNNNEYIPKVKSFEQDPV